MNSFIFASDSMPDLKPAADLDPRWRRWIFVYAALLAGFTASIFVAVVVLDPFSTGRLTPIQHFNITTNKRLFAHAGRIRDPHFNAAIFGNSRAFTLDPARLGDATGYRMVNLAMEAQLPPEQRLLLRAFVDHHRGRAPLVIMVLDEGWCSSVRHRSPYQPPVWLYRGSQTEYLRHILSPVSVKAAFTRALILLGVRKDVKRRDGFDPFLPREGPMMRARMIKTAQPVDGEPLTAPFPNLDDLKEALAGIEARSAVILIFPPVYAGQLPSPGSPAQARVDACKARVIEIAAERRGTAYLDLWKDFPKTRDPMNFLDAIHFLEPVARDVEEALAQRIRELVSSASGRPTPPS